MYIVYVCYLWYALQFVYRLIKRTYSSHMCVCVFCLYRKRALSRYSMRFEARKQ